MYNVEDLVESTVKKMHAAKIIKFAQEYYDEFEEDGWPEEEREPKPKNLIESIEYLDIFGFMITKA